MFQIRSTATLLSVILAIPAALCSAQGRNGISAADVDKAIERTVGYLLKAQAGDGGWSEYQDYDRGVSSLVTLALIIAGENPESPAITRAMNWVSAKPLDKTYTVSLQTMAMCATDPNRYAKQIEVNLQWLIKRQLTDGGWGYGTALDRSDESNSQFALLAIHEAERVGIVIPKDVLEKSFDAARSYWYRRQKGDGSFGYDNQNQSGSMTCAGLGSLIIVGSKLNQLDAAGQNGIQCCGQSDDNRRRIEAAIDWMGRNFSIHTNPGTHHFYYYYMYGLERAGRLSGRRYFVNPASGEPHDWYREGAKFLIGLQNPDGSFRDSDTGNGYSSAALALLFLAKGKRQVVMNQLQYGNDLDWNHHPMSVQHLTMHTEQAWKRDLTWQTVRLNNATVEDLMEAPVLFISGSHAPNYTRDEKLLLKRYVENGGFIFAEACNGDGCRGAEFEEYFKRLVVELFEQPLEKLSPDHPLWTAETNIQPEDLPPGTWLYGVQSCCRLGVVYVPYSLSCRWELNVPYGSRPDYSAAVQSDMDTATKIGVNVLTYVTGKELKQKLDSVSVLEQVVQKTATDRGLFHLPVLAHNAGSDDAPRAVTTLVEWLNQENPFQMSSEKRVIPITAESLQPYPVVFMHGRGELHLSEAEREALREHFANGGSLICDSICADEQFTDSFRSEMEIVLGKPLAPLNPSQHPLFTRKYYGFDISELSVIDPLPGSTAGLAANIRKRAPIIEAGYHDNRIAVLFSPLDISCALESKHSLQCKGYIREDAARLGINMVLFAMQQQ